MSTVAASRASREPLLGPSSQRLEVGLLGARTAAVLRRIANGVDLDDVDRMVLDSAVRVMQTSADAVEVIAAGGQLKRDRGSLGFDAMAFAVECAAPEIPPSDLPEFLRTIARELTELQTKPDPDVASHVLPAFSMLADFATRTTGTVGEGGGSLI